MAIYALVDGGSYNNQDPAKRKAYGSFYIVEGPLPFEMEGTLSIRWEIMEFGNETNNEAEYRIVKECLLYCLTAGIRDIHIGTDSNLVYKQLLGEFDVKAPNLLALHTEIKLLISRMGNVSIQKVPRAITRYYLGH